MEFVAKDKGGDWHWDGDITYYCLNKAGAKVAKIYAEYVPDPYLLWQSKCNQAEVQMSSQDGKQLRPNDVVFKLWEHKRENVEE